MATSKVSASTRPAQKSASAKKSAAKKVPAKKAAASKEEKTAAKKQAPVEAAAKATGRKSSVKKAAGKDKYTDPALRDKIKAKVLREDKGGRAGQWSARKAQMVAHEYEAEGGTYKGGRDATQQSLTAWGDEHWTTKDGKPARQEDGMHRYLPAEAWKELTPAQKRSTENKKLAGDKKGKQFVANTKPAVKARHDAQK